MTANVDIMIQHMDNVLTVPLVAVMDDGDGAYVNVVTSRDEKGYPQVERVSVTVKHKVLRRPSSRVLALRTALR